MQCASVFSLVWLLWPGAFSSANYFITCTGCFFCHQYFCDHNAACKTINPEKGWNLLYDRGWEVKVWGKWGCRAGSWYIGVILLLILEWITYRCLNQAKASLFLHIFYHSWKIWRNNSLKRIFKYCKLFAISYMYIKKNYCYLWISLL